MSPYRTDLAHIHDDAYGHLAAGAAEVLIAGLRERGIHEGTVVDLGCGSGLTARILAGAGYAVTGIDLSEALIAIARERSPQATFRVGSFVDAKLPPCVAVCAIGEVLSYAFDERSDDASRARLIADIAAALTPGGLFLLDVAGPDRAPAETTRTFAEGEDWAVLIETSAAEETLVRRITTFRRDGELYRRDAEAHVLRLLAPDRIEAELHAADLRVERIRTYGPTPLPPGLHAFIACKPPGGL